MNKFIRILLSIILIFLLNPSFGQNKFFSYNQRRMDTVRRDLKKICNNYVSSKTTTKKGIKADRKLVTFLNKFYNNDLTISEFKKILNKSFRSWELYSINLGGATKYEIKIRPDGNLISDISFSTFRNEIVFKRINFVTEAKTNCLNPNEPMVALQDISYLETNCLSLIEFPILNGSYFFLNDIIYCDTTYVGKLRKFDTTVYKFCIVDTGRVNETIWNQVDTYYTDGVVYDISTIVKDNNTDLLYLYLFSPNYTLAIYAMEALIYLQSENKVDLSAEIKKKMEEIRNADIPIRYQYSDVVRNGFKYRDLKIADDEIIFKYRRMMRDAAKKLLKENNFQKVFQ